MNEKLKVVFAESWRKHLPRGYRRLGGFTLSTDNIHEVLSFMENNPKFAAIHELLSTVGAEFRLGPTRALATRVSTADRLANRGVKLVRPDQTNTLFIGPSLDGNEITTAMIATAKLIAINIAVSLAVSAVMMLMTPKTETSTDTRKNKLYEIGVNTNKEGVVNPYTAGRRVLVGGNIIEGSVKVTGSGFTGEFIPGPAAIAAGHTQGLSASGQFEPGSGLDLIRQAVMGGKGKGKPMANNAHSNSSMNVLIALGVGEIGGILGETDHEKLENIFIDEMPVRTPDGDENWHGVVFETRPGVAGQLPILITPGVSNTFDSAIELPKLDSHDQQFYYPFVITSPEATLVDVRFNYVAKSSDSKGGEHAELIELGMDTKREGDANWYEYGVYKHKLKSSEPIQASIPVKAPPHNTHEKWQIRVYRITPDSVLDRVQNATTFQGWTETIERELAYDGSNGEPPTALLGISLDAEAFGAGVWPEVAALCMGVKVPVPDNYNVETRTYSGEWFGDFKYEATDNPVWHWRHLATGPYGVGAGLPEWMFDKFRLYGIAQYCDQKVGGRFRHSLNKQFVDQTDTWEFLTELAKSFGAYPTWMGNEIRLIADMPRPVTAHINNDSAFEGDFQIESTPLALQVNEVEVEYDNPDDFFRKAIVTYRDDASIARNKANGLGNDGRVTNRVYKNGCTDPRDALAFGMALVYKAQSEPETIAWTTNLAGCSLFPGDIVEVSDWTTNGEQATGRVLDVQGSSITLDNAITFQGGTSYSIHAQGPNGLVIKPVAMFGSETTTDVISVTGHGLPIGSPISIVKNAGGAVPITYEIMGRTQKSTGQYELLGIQHNPGRYQYLDSNQPIVVPPWTSLGTSVPKPTGLKARSWGQQDDVLGASFNIEVSWDAMNGKPIRGYRLEALFPGESTWRVLHEGLQTVFVIRNAMPGPYIFTLKAVNVLGATSAPTAPLEFLLGPNGEGDLLPPVFMGLDDVSNSDVPSNHFTGKDLRVRFREDLLNIGAYAYQADFVLAGGEVYTTYVKQSDPEGTLVVGDVEARTFSAILPYEVNASMGLTRDPIIRIRTQGADGRWSGQWLVIEAHNPVPIITTLPTVTSQLGSVSVDIKKLKDPDVAGYLMALSTVEEFDPELNLFKDFTSNSFVAELPTGGTYWAKFAAYDAFGTFGIVWTVSMPVSAHTADFDEWQDKIDAMEDVTDEIRQGGYAKAADLLVVARTIQKDQMLSVGERWDRIEADHIDGVPNGTIIKNEIERTDDLVETTGLIAVKAEDGLSVLLRTDKVMVRDGVSMAQMEVDLKAETAAAKSFVLAATDAVASDLQTEVTARTTLGSAYADNKAIVDTKLNTLANENETSAEFQNVMSATGVQGDSIVLDTTKVKYSATETIAERNSLVQSQFDGTATGGAKSYLLNTVLTKASETDVHADILTQLVGTLNGNTAAAIDATRIKLSPTETAADRFISLNAELGNKATAASVTTQITAAIGPGSTLAQQITNAQSTANGASSQASIAISAINGNDASIAMFTRTGSTLTGVKINGASSAITLLASSVGFVSTAGGIPVMALQVVGNKVIATNFQADDIKAGIITAGMVYANNLTQTTQVINNGSTTLSTGEQTMVSGSVSVSGRCDITVMVNFNQTSGSPAGTLCYIYRNGSLLDSFGVYCQGAWGGNTGFYMVTDYPGAGNHTYSMTAATAPGSSGNPTKTRARIIANVKKTET